MPTILWIDSIETHQAWARFVIHQSLTTMWPIHKFFLSLWYYDPWDTAKKTIQIWNYVTPNVIMEQCFGTKKSKRVEFNWATVTYIVYWLNKTEPESESAAFPRFSSVPGLRRTSITCQTENSRRPESRQKQQSLIKPTNNALNVLCTMQIIQTIRTVTSTSTLKGIETCSSMC